MAMSVQQKSVSRKWTFILIVALVLVLAFLACTFLPLLVFYGPLILEKTIAVTDSPLSQIPERFHPHFATNAAHISGEYSSMTRQCNFTYSCTREDFRAMIEREKLAPNNKVEPEDGTIAAGRQWGPGIASYTFSSNSETATVEASAW
jgi:hypothetical protein